MSGGLVLISDLHLANRRGFGKQPVNPLFKGCNTRLHNILLCLDDAYRYAIANGCEAVAILGDVFHERGVLQVPVLNAFYKVMSNYKDAITTYMFPGNHDFVDSRALWGDEGYSSLYVFNEIAAVIHEPATAETDNFLFTMIPFNISAEQTIDAAARMFIQHPGKVNLLLLHHSILGAETGPANWQMPHEIAPKDLPDKYNLIFSGHLHKHQTLEKKVTYVGAPLHHDLGERDYKPGFVHVLPDGTWKHIENKASPRFAYTEAKVVQDLADLDPKNYNVIVWQGDTAQGERLKQDENLLVEIQPEIETLVKRTSISSKDSMPEMIRKYVNARFGEEKPEVFDIGVKLYNGDM